ncbi:hypothetical protein SXCC_02529 [Gluconacetobacter sp. SXCC-1]|nr:hypothetical protein SXCC_02529 [Gluconacetobacter sp. SXCC-1]
MPGNTAVRPHADGVAGGMDGRFGRAVWTGSLAGDRACRTLTRHALTCHITTCHALTCHHAMAAPLPTPTGSSAA